MSLKKANIRGVYFWAHGHLFLRDAKEVKWVKLANLTLQFSKKLTTYTPFYWYLFIENASHQTFFSFFFTKKQNHKKLLPAQCHIYKFQCFFCNFLKVYWPQKLVSIGVGQSARMIFNVSRIAQSLIMHAYLCFKNF